MTAPDVPGPSPGASFEVHPARQGRVLVLRCTRPGRAVWFTRVHPGFFSLRASVVFIVALHDRPTKRTHKITLGFDTQHARCQGGCWLWLLGNCNKSKSKSALPHNFTNLSELTTDYTTPYGTKARAAG